MGRLYRFIRYNKFKSITVRAWVYSAMFRFQMLYTRPDKLPAKWGIEGEESPEAATLEEYRYAKGVSYAVNRVCNKTKWESKCLVRALPAQKILRQKKIQSTLYLGCRLENGKMVAHAWLRCGRMYVTGGDGTGYTIVDKFRTE